MTLERLQLDPAAIQLSADPATRTIQGVAIPANASATKGGLTWKFAAGSVQFAERTPVLQYHDPSRPVGRLVSGNWSERGLEVSLSISDTPAGTEALRLAADGVLGISIGIDVDSGGARKSGTTLNVSRATAKEVSLTPLPAFAGAVVDKVTFTEESTVADDDKDKTVTPAASPFDYEKFSAALATALTPPKDDDKDKEGPEVVPVTTPAVFVKEEAPYRFDGTGGQHGFVADAYDAYHGDGEANARLEKFLHETFVTQANVATLNPVPSKPDMYVNSLRWNGRPLAAAISTGTIEDSTPFIVPKFSSAGTLVAAHTEGVEPSLATYVATSQTITPGAISGKAEITREVWDARGNPQVDQMVWDEMVNAHWEALEARIATLLEGLTPTAIPIVGVDAAGADDLVAALTALQFEKGGHRFNSLVAASNLYTMLSGAKDSTGRKLYPIIGAVNADGTTAADFGSIRVGNATVVPAWGLGTSSYLLVKGSTWQWSSAPKKMTFDIQVKSVYLGLFAYAAEANTRLADIRELTYSAS